MKTMTDSLNKVCQERGHVMPEAVTSTLMCCEPYLIETDSTTIKVYPACNWISYRCVRCGQEITYREPERRVLIWKKGEQQ